MGHMSYPADLVAAEILKLQDLLELLRRSGASEDVIDALLGEKVSVDRSTERERYRLPSRN